MAILEIRIVPDPILKIKAHKIKKIDDSNEVRTPRVVEWSPSRGPVDTCWVRFVRTSNNYSLNGGNSPCH